MQLEPTDDVVPYIAQTIRTHLENDEKVLWLVCGGSGISVAIAVSKELAQLDLTNLYVTLTDERYVPFDGADENWKQLLDGGFRLPGATTYRVLQHNLDRTQTTAAYEKTLESWIDLADYSIGFFGIGPDGHTAGIKPGSPAVASIKWATDFVGEDFERITTTPHFIAQLDEAIVYAVGETKFAVLDALLHQELPLETQPAQVLKQAAKSILFTDYKEEK